MGDALSLLAAIPGWAELTILALILAVGVFTATAIATLRRAHAEARGRTL